MAGGGDRGKLKLRDLAIGVEKTRPGFVLSGTIFIPSLSLIFSTFEGHTASLTEFREGGFIKLPSAVLVLARLLHDVVH